MPINIDVPIAGANLKNSFGNMLSPSRLGEGQVLKTSSLHVFPVTAEREIENPLKSQQSGYLYEEGANMSERKSKSNLPVCTVTKAQKLERCIVKLKKKGTAVSPQAVCMVSVGCRKGGSQMSEAGDTIKITGTCEDSPDKCVYTLKRVGTSLKIVGTKQLSRAIEAPALKESVPVAVLRAIENPVEVKV